MFDPQRVQSLVDGGERLVERPLEVCEVVGFAVVMCGSARWVLRTALADVRQSPMQQGQHVLPRGRIEQSVVLAGADVDRGGVRHDAATPAVMMGNRIVARTA